MNNQNEEMNFKNLDPFLKDSEQLLESKTFGKWHSNEVAGETETGEPIYQFPYVEYTPAVNKFLESFYTNDIHISYESSEISEYLEKVKDLNTELSSYSVEDLRRMLTIIVRGDRFFEGLLLEYLENEGIQRILKALQKKY
jgi:hypothetical protein